MFVDYFAESENLGIFQTCGTPTQIGSSVMVDAWLAATVRVAGSNSGSLFAIGEAGHLYSLDLQNSILTDIRPDLIGGAGNNTATGISIYKPQDSTEYLYYFLKTAIGRWDLINTVAGGGFQDAWETGLENTLHHPNHFFKGDIFFGNKNMIGRIYNISGSGATVATTAVGLALTLAADFTVTCIDDDGDYLIAGITKNAVASNLRADTRIIFWDTVSQKFNKEWLLPDPTIIGIKKFEEGHLAFGSRGIYYFSIGRKPKRLKNFGTGQALGVGFPFAVDYLGDGLLWGGGDTYLNFYGKLIADVPRAYFQPFYGSSGQATYVNSIDVVNKVLVATAAPALYSFTLSDSGSTSSAQIETIYFDLKGEWNVELADIILAEPLAVGDSMTLQYQTDEDTAAADFGTIAYDANLDDPVPRRRIQLSPGNQIQATHLKYLFNPTAGNVKIKSITTYGTPIRGLES